MFKKIFLFVAIFAVAMPAAMAQDEMDMLRNKVNKERKDHDSRTYWRAVYNTWSHTSYANFAYIADQKIDIDGAEYNSKWGAGIEVGNHFMFPKKPIIGFMKFGFDIDWLDLSYVKYENYPSIFNKAASRSFLGEGLHQFTAGMGVGLSFHIAPFEKAGSALQPLRFSIHGRFLPQYSGVMFDADNLDETKFTGAFLPQIGYGVDVEYKGIGVGAQMRFGDAKYKNLIVDDGVKQKMKNTSTRFYIAIHF